MSLEQVLADFAEDAAVLRRRGHPNDAAIIEQMVSEVRKVAEPWITWLSESDAILRSGNTPNWFRRNRAYWRQLGLVKYEGKTFYYCQAIVPQRVNLDAVREDAKRAAHEDAA